MMDLSCLTDAMNHTQGCAISIDSEVVEGMLGA